MSRDFWRSRARDSVDAVGLGFKSQVFGSGTVEVSELGLGILLTHRLQYPLIKEYTLKL